MSKTTIQNLTDAIDAVLPQTQCRACGYPGCRPYAEAIAKGEATIEKCAPGGLTTLAQLATITDSESLPYQNIVTAQYRSPSIARIREAECIGCTKCLQACPVDAIIGAAKQMHVILAQECTGCELCIAPCPVDCIDLLPQTTHTFDKSLAQKRFNDKLKRQTTPTSDAATIAATKSAATNASNELPPQSPAPKTKAELQAEIAAALARVAQKK